MDQSIHICNIIQALIIILHLHHLFSFCPYMKSDYFWELIHAITRPNSHQQMDIGLYSSRAHKCMCMGPSFCKQMCTFSLSVKFKGICLSSSKNANGKVSLFSFIPLNLAIFYFWLSFKCMASFPLMIVIWIYVGNYVSKIYPALSV